MNWQKLIAIAVGVLLFGTVCFLLGRSSKQPDPPIQNLKTVWKHDTTFVKIPGKPINVKDTTSANRTKTTVTSATAGTKSGVSYQAEVTISDLDKDLEKYPANWEVNILPPEEKIMIVRDTLTIDKTKTEVVTKYLKPPFFLNEWFYVSLFTAVISALVIIFQ